MVAALGGAYWLAKRTVRWNDARTMPPPLEAAVRAYGKGDDDAGARNVAGFLRRYRAPAWEARARVLAATHLVRDGHPSDVTKFLPSDLQESEPLAPVARLLRARACLARGESQRAEDLARGVVAATGVPLADEARLVLADAQEARGAWQDAIRTAGTGTAAAIVEGAKIASKHGDVEGARRRLVEPLLAASGADEVETLAAALEEMVPDAASRFPSADRPRLAAAARSLLDDGRVQPSLDLLAAARPGGAPSAATPDEALVEAEALVKLGRSADAARALVRARQGDPAVLDGVRYVDAKIAAAGGRFDSYRGGLAALGARGRSPWRERALLDLAKNIEGIPNAATLDAYRRYRAAAGAKADPLAFVREGWAAYDLGRMADADAAFARALAAPDAPGGVRVTSLYWRARIDDRAGRAADAREGYRRTAEEFPNHYYGLLAARRLGRPAPSAPRAEPDPRDPSRLGAAGRWVAAARQLVSVGLWDDAAPLYRWSVRQAGSRANAVAIAIEGARAARDAAALSDAVAIAQLAVGERDRTPVESIPLPLWQLLYPAPSADAIAAAAKESGLEPSLVASVALQESAFNPIAVSSAGARGLLQVMPAVGAELAARLGIKSYDERLLFDPTVNLRLGCAHLKDYARRFGSVETALAAYNGGPSRVERWAVPDHLEDERFVERIPIPETRIYVKRVMAGARMYALVWPSGLGAS